MKSDEFRARVIIGIGLICSLAFQVTALADFRDCGGAKVRANDRTGYENCIRKLDKKNEASAKVKAAKQNTRVYRNVPSIAQERREINSNSKRSLHFTEKPNRSAQAAKSQNGLKKTPRERYSAVIPRGEKYREANVAGGDKKSKEVLISKSDARKWQSGERHKYKK